MRPELGLGRGGAFSSPVPWALAHTNAFFLAQGTKVTRGTSPLYASGPAAVHQVEWVQYRLCDCTRVYVSDWGPDGGLAVQLAHGTSGFT